MSITGHRASIFILGAAALASGFAVAPAATAAPADTFDQGWWIEQMPDILSQRERPPVFNRLLQDRLDNLLPALMRETGVDMWLVLNREYAEDPVYFTLVPQPTHAARRTTMLIFHDRGDEGVDRLTVNRYPLGGPYESAWDAGDGNLDAQWQRLGELIAERNPKKIGVNVSRDWPAADGLSHALYERLVEVLTPELRERVVSAEELAIRWFETRIDAEMEIYPQIVSMARRVISEAFSNQVITPGATTTDDVAWYIAQRFADLQLPIWFQPSVDIQRAGQECGQNSPFCGASGETVIRRGDVIHTDVGVCYLGLCTDTQEMGYILRNGEREVPAALEKALDQGNRWQDILTGNFVSGRSGNEILAATGEQCREEGLVCSTYTHPIGNHGHGVGPTIGMWDNQGDTKPRGDWPLYVDTAFSIEGNTRMPLDAWDGQYVVIKLEQDAFYDGEDVWYIAGRQTEWHVVE